jgi:hypothetical protein
MASGRGALFVMLALFGVLWAFLPHLRYAESFSGQVIDPAGQPVKDAVVMVGWRFQSGGGSPVPLKLKEARTDGNGRYMIEGWGPELMPFSYTRLGRGEPTLSVIHPEHPPMKFASGASGRNGRSILNVTPDGFGSVRLSSPLPNGDITRQYADQFDFDIYTHYAHGPLRCRWSSVPMFVEAMRTLEKRLELPLPYFVPSASFC